MALRIILVFALTIGVISISKELSILWGEVNSRENIELAAQLLIAMGAVYGIFYSVIQRKNSQSVLEQMKEQSEIYRDQLELSNESHRQLIRFQKLKSKPNFTVRLLKSYRVLSGEGILELKLLLVNTGLGTAEIISFETSIEGTNYDLMNMNLKQKSKLLVPENDLDSLRVRARHVSDSIPRWVEPGQTVNLVGLIWDKGFPSYVSPESLNQWLKGITESKFSIRYNTVLEEVEVQDNISVDLAESDGLLL